MFGQVIGPIPWDAIIAYAGHKQLERDNTEFLVAVIRELDEAYLEWQRTEQKGRETIK